MKAEEGYALCDALLLQIDTLLSDASAIPPEGGFEGRCIGVALDIIATATGEEMRDGNADWRLFNAQSVCVATAALCAGTGRALILTAVADLLEQAANALDRFAHDDDEDEDAAPAATSTLAESRAETAVAA